MQPIIDTELSLSRKRRAKRAAVDGADFLMARTVDDLRDRLGTVERVFPKAAALCSLTAAARDVLVESGKAIDVVRVENDPAFLDGDGVVAPAETVSFDAASLDLIVSLLSLHEANDIPGVLVQIRRALRPDGLFLGAMAGGATLNELRESLIAAETLLYGGVSPRVLPFADVRDVGALLQRAGFALPVADVETVTVRYRDMFGLMRDLRAMGATNALLARSRRPATGEFLVKAAELYAARFSDGDGRIRATFSIVWMSGWAPDASQQKPLRPGSAQVSLAEALNKTAES